MLSYQITWRAPGHCPLPELFTLLEAQFLPLPLSLTTNHCDLLASAPPSNVMSSAANPTSMAHDSLNITEEATRRDSVGV